MSFGLSAGVYPREIDNSAIIPVVNGTTAGFAGVFRWGPVGIANLVSSEASLLSQYVRPNDSVTGIDYLLAQSYLAYSPALLISRAAAVAAINAASPIAGGTVAGTLIPNANVFTGGTYTPPVGDHFAARYPGLLGNSIQVVVVDTATQFTDPSFAAYRRLFPSAPGTSAYAARFGASADELHLVVVDTLGYFTGVAGQVLEQYGFLSKAPDALNSNGTTNYYLNVLNALSQYVYGLNPDNTVAGLGIRTGTAASVVAAAYPSSTSLTSLSYVFSLGLDGVVADSDRTTAYTVFVNKDVYPIDLLILGVSSPIVVNAVLSNVISVRLDLVGFTSPPQALVVGQTNFDTVAQAVVTYRTTTLNINSSYVVLDSGWKYMYDRFNDIYRWVPLNSDVAGLCSRTDTDRDPWYSPAGFNRGQIKNVVRLGWSPNEAQRDLLFSNNINPIVAFPGQGTVLYGDKTLQNKTSAFDRINVRRLFIILEKAISKAAQSLLFEFNDEFTRAQFVALVEPFLSDVKGRRGISDFKVIADSSNNTTQVIASNQFVGDIYIKPNYAISFIRLNFIAVRDSVQFTSIAGG